MAIIQDMKVTRDHVSALIRTIEHSECETCGSPLDCGFCDWQMLIDIGHDFVAQAEGIIYDD